MKVSKSTKKPINVMATSVLAATMLLTPLTNLLPGHNGVLHAEETRAKDTNKGIKEADKIAESRTFHIKGKGPVKQLREIDRRRMSFSPFEPTGLYAKPNEKITIHVEGSQSVQAYMGTYSYDRNPDTFTLKPGENEISSVKGGILYFGNTNEEGEIQVKVTSGGEPIPYFELGKHTQADWDTMMKQFPNAYAVELKGERSLFTVTYQKAKEYLEGKDPSALIRKHDEAIRIQDKVSGLSENYTGVAKADSHYVHFVEDYNKKDGWMYATEYRTAYISNAIKSVLDLESFEKDGWGPWHEAGHQRQQQPWLWSGLSEVTVNIYSLSVQRAFGNTSRLETDRRYEEAFQYLNQSDNQKSFDKFEPLVMFWQLDLAFGENFYPKLHQMYRLIPQKELNGISDDEKKQLFITMASNVSNRNLTPFFEKWGLMPSEVTKNKIKDLPKLEKEIWLGRDSKPIIENNLPEYHAPSGGTPIPQTIEVGFDETDVDVNKFVKDLPENISVTGNIDLYSAQVGSSFAKVEIADKDGNKNMVFVPIIDIAPPSNPTQLETINQTTNRIFLTWNASKDNVGVVKYLIYRNGELVGSQKNGLGYIDEKLQANTEYVYTVKAVDAAGNESKESDPLKTRTKEESKIIKAQGQSADTLPEWEISKVYNNDDKIQYNGLEYQAKYWTQGNQPDVSDHWKLVSNVIQKWNDKKAYNGGDKVQFQGLEYQAKYWTQGNQPDVSDHWKLVSNVIQEWNNKKAYNVDDKVQFQGLEYQAKYWTQGNQPDVSDSWKLVSNVIPKWNDKKPYNYNDKVQYQGLIYQAKQWSSGQTPSSKSLYWEVVDK